MSGKGNNLLPPFLSGKFPMSPSSWMNDRLPEMIWAALIRVTLGQELGLGIFRRFLNFIGKHASRDLLSDITLTGISRLPADLCDEVISFIVEPPQVVIALQPLHLFEGLPARGVWLRRLPRIDVKAEPLMNAIGATLWHQSQEATDCRWFRVMAQVIAGKFHIPQEIAKDWFGYPHEGDQRSVRPFIRASEIAPSSLNPPDMAWPNAFWHEGLANTPCMTLKTEKPDGPIEVGLTRQRLHKVTDLLRSHWHVTHQTTSIDARHDGSFGMAFYSLAILEELLGIGVSTGIIGRLGLRTILETHINLKFLHLKGDLELWKKWRSYGAGQAKLSSLKFDGMVAAPKHIDLASLEQIANEDFWEEFVTINLASWSGSDLRRISEQADAKAVYDQFYGWSSGYAHAMWGPIRESCFKTCGNPLHRLHRYPDNHTLPDVVDDAALLVDGILEQIDLMFPSFPHRLLNDGEPSNGANQ